MRVSELRTLRTLVRKANVEVRSSLMKHEYPSMAAFLRDVRRDKVPLDLVSPGWVVGQVGISRQAVHKAINEGWIDSWHVRGGYVFIRQDQATERWLTK